MEFDIQKLTKLIVAGFIVLLIIIVALLLNR